MKVTRSVSSSVTWRSFGISTASSSSRRGTDGTADLDAFVALYVDFLNLHHPSDDEFVFSALRRHSAARTTGSSAVA